MGEIHSDNNIRREKMTMKAIQVSAGETVLRSRSLKFFVMLITQM
mgnify:CR=1 FL=1